MGPTAVNFRINSEVNEKKLFVMLDDQDIVSVIPGNNFMMRLNFSGSVGEQLDLKSGFGRGGRGKDQKS